MAERTVPETGTNGGRSNGHLEEKVIEEWRNAAYNCFSSGHKFCREVCPVMQVTRDERHTPTAFHANVVAIDKGLLGIEDVAEDYVHCTMCGACELRCPNTLFTGDFYRFRQRTIDVVQAMRSARCRERHPPTELAAVGRPDRPVGNEPVLGWNIETGASKVRAWATGLDIRPAARPCCSPTARRRSTDLGAALGGGDPPGGRLEFGLMSQQWCCGGPMWETGYVDVAHKMAEHNMIDWRKTGTKRIICLDPHDYITIVEYYPADRRQLRRVRDRARRRPDRRDDPRRQARADDADRAHGHLPRSVPPEQAPRHLAVAARDPAGDPGPHVRGRRPCNAVVVLLGGGSNLWVEKPRSQPRSRRRVEKAKALEGVTTLVSACPWSERRSRSRARRRGSRSTTSSSSWPKRPDLVSSALLRKFGAPAAARSAVRRPRSRPYLSIRALPASLPGLRFARRAITEPETEH